MEKHGRKVSGGLVVRGSKGRLHRVDELSLGAREKLTSQKREDTVLSAMITDAQVRDMEGAQGTRQKQGGRPREEVNKVSTRFPSEIGGEVNSTGVKVAWSSGTEIAGYALRSCIEKVRRYPERISKRQL